MDFVADTTLLVGIWRRQPWALTWMESNTTAVLHIPWIVLGEFWHGAIRARHDEVTVNRFLELGRSMDDTGPVVRAYARLCAEHQDQAFFKSIGQNDLWIAACSLSAEFPLVTRNSRHFTGLSGLALNVVGA